MAMSDDTLRTRIRAQLTAVTDPALAAAIENAIVEAVDPAPPVDTEALAGATDNGDGTATLPSGELVPVSRDETADSIDENGALTEVAMARRADLTAQNMSDVALAQAALDTANAELMAAEDDEAVLESKVAQLKQAAQEKADALAAAQKKFEEDEAAEAEARAQGVAFEGDPTDPAEEAEPEAEQEDVVDPTT